MRRYVVSCYHRAAFRYLPSWCDDIIWAQWQGSGTMGSGSYLPPTQEQSLALSDINLLPLEENKAIIRWRHLKAAVCHQGKLPPIHSLTDMLAVVLNNLVSYFLHLVVATSFVHSFTHGREYEACLTLWRAESWKGAWWEVPAVVECVQQLWLNLAFFHSIISVFLSSQLLLLIWALNSEALSSPLTLLTSLVVS